MNEPSEQVKNLIAARSVIRPDSMSPNEFRSHWRACKQVAINIRASLTTQNPDMQSLADMAEDLVCQIGILRQADADLRNQTPNLKRPRPYRLDAVDHAQEIERHLLHALESVQDSDGPETLKRLFRSTSSAYHLVLDAWQEGQKNIDPVPF